MDRAVLRAMVMLLVRGAGSGLDAEPFAIDQPKEPCDRGRLGDTAEGWLLS